MHTVDSTSAARGSPPTDKKQVCNRESNSGADTLRGQGGTLGQFHGPTAAALPTDPLADPLLAGRFGVKGECKSGEMGLTMALVHSHSKITPK